MGGQERTVAGFEDDQCSACYLTVAVLKEIRVQALVHHLCCVVPCCHDCFDGRLDNHHCPPQVLFLCVVGVLSVCMFVHRVHAWCPWRAGKGAQIP